MFDRTNVFISEISFISVKKFFFFSADYGISVKKSFLCLDVLRT